MNKSHEWERCDAQIFWGEIAPASHVVQFYDDEDMFINMLGSFVTGGFRNGDSVVVIATAEHRKAIHEGIESQGFNPVDLVLKGQYVVLDAKDTLSKFFTHGYVDEFLFRQTIGQVLRKVKRHHRPNIRAFGEMVALLWQEGYEQAAIDLEECWNRLMKDHNFCLLCAYPKNLFKENADTSIQHICNTHAQLLTPVQKESNDILYKTVRR